MHIELRRLIRWYWSEPVGLTDVCQWPPSFGPTAGLCTLDKCCCHQSPPPSTFDQPPHQLSAFLSPFPILSLLRCITYVHASTLFPVPPLSFPYISVPYSFLPVIRSWRPPAGVNGGESHPWVSGCISSLRCSPASNEEGHCQKPASRCARHTQGHNEQGCMNKGKSKNKTKM